MAIIPYNFDKSLNNLLQNIRILDLYRISYNIGFLTNMLSNLSANLENIIVEDLNCFSEKQSYLISTFKNKYDNRVQIIDT